MSDKNREIEQDYNESRETYNDLIDKGRESLELMIQVARESEHPRAFEVLSGMIKISQTLMTDLWNLTRSIRKSLK